MDGLRDNHLFLPQVLEERLEKGADSTFVFYQHGDGTCTQVSYNKIKEESEILLSKLQSAGLRKGDRIGVACALCPLWYSVLRAALRGGYRMVCIDPGIPVNQIHSMLRRTECRCVVTTMSAFKLPAIFDGRIPVYSAAEGFPLLCGSEKVDLLLGSASAMEDEAFFILFSSGTTGDARKGVLLPHSSLTTAVEFAMNTDSGVYKNTRSFDFDAKRSLVMFPPYHIAGLLVTALYLYTGTQIIILERTNATTLMNALTELKPDNFCTVPSVMAVLVKKVKAELNKNKLAAFFVKALSGLCGFMRRYLGINAGRRLMRFANKKAFGGNMRQMVCGASPCDAQVMEFLLNMGIDVNLSYGLTELGAPLACTGRGYYPGTTGRIFYPKGGLDIRVVNPDENGRGEVEVLSPLRMISYLNSAENDGCFTEDGYFHTGDLGYFDKRKCLAICGRAKETMVLRNGEKLLPEEIEKYYANMKDIGEYAVFRVPDGDCDGFSLALVKETQKGLPDESLKMHAVDRANSLPPAYRPREIYVLHELPYSSTHKVQRFRLTEMAVKGLSAPISDATQKIIDEDGTVAELRELLAAADGARWESMELAEGTILDIDSLTTMELFVSVQEHFGVDMFKLLRLPETFGELYDAVTRYDELDKNTKPEINLADYPQPVTKTEAVFYGALREGLKAAYHVHGNGEENIPTGESFIICSNHITTIDPAWILSCMPREIADKTCVVGKSDLVGDKILGNIARSQHYIPVDRAGNFMATMDRCRELINEGKNILIFPEGTNYENATEMLQFKEGPARLALATGACIIPAQIKGAGRMDSNIKGKLLPPVSKRVDVVFGEKITPGDITPEELNAILRARMEAL